MQRDIYYAQARNHPSALEAALFPDRVPSAVYDNLIASVHRHLPAVHHYYDVRRRKMRLKDIHHYDTYVPILAELQTRHTWNQAVAAVLAALEPLGSDYCGTLERGLDGPLVRPLRKSRQAERRVQLRLVRRRSLHPHELSGRRAGPRLHPGPRGGPLDAQLLLGQAPAVHLLQLHDFRGRGGQHRSTSNCSAGTSWPAPATTASGRS